MTPARARQVLIGASRVQEELLRVSWKHKAQQFLGDVWVEGNNIIPGTPAPRSATRHGAEPARGFPEIEMQTSIPFTSPVTLKELEIK